MHWSTLHGTQPDPHRISLQQRADGVILALEIIDDRPAFVALLPDRPVRRRVVLEGAELVAQARAQIEEVYPPSPWMLEAEHGQLDLDPMGDGYRLPFLHFGDPEAVVFVDTAESGEVVTLHVSTAVVSYMQLRIAAVEVTIAGKGSVTLSHINVAGGKRLIVEPWTVLGVGDDKDEPKVHVLRALREFPAIPPGNNADATLCVRGTARVTVSLVVHGYADAGRRSPFASPSPFGMVPG